MKGTTKSLGQKDKNDKFYTKSEIVDYCLSFIEIDKYNKIIEPSAGDGAFLKKLPNAIGYDIDPEADDIVKQDFLSLENPKEENILIIGNPPFGVQSNLAIKFFNKAAEFCDTIAFILPRSFCKDSIKNRLNLNFHLIKEEILPEDSFLLNNKNYSVPCVFQIWEKRSIKRKKIKLPLTSDYFEFTKEIAQADFRVQRVGGNAGKAFLDKNGAISSNYYLINKSNYTTEELVKIINSIVFPSIALTVGPKSLSKGELCYEVKKNIEDIFS